MSKDVDTLFTFYAKSHEDAEQKTEKILQQYPYTRLELKEYPHGFRMVMTHIPGRIDE